GGLWLGWRFTQSKFYVGATEDGTVAIFQGIPGRIAGFELSTVDYVSDTNLDELTPVAQERVKEGIGAETREEAEEQLRMLLDPGNKNLLPDCPTPTPTASPPATASASPSPPPSPGTAVSPGAQAPLGSASP